MKPILVTGGAGYIGSQVVKELIGSGRENILVVDNLSTGKKSAVLPPATLITSDLGDFEKLKQIFLRHRPQAVLHFAASTDVADSMAHPDKYYENNVINGLNLLNAMMLSGSKKIIFSSSAAVYGEAGEIPITEETAVKPMSPYGTSKYIFEKILAAYDQVYGLKSISLRYFNAAGADTGGELGGDYQNKVDLISALVKTALGLNNRFIINGIDLDTRDGSCVRDLIHVNDLASAHVLALDHLLNGGSSDIFNLGSEQGFTVREAVAAAKQVTQVDFAVEAGPRRAGDIPVSVASSQRARAVLGWKQQHSSLNEIIRTAWEWAQKDRRAGRLSSTRR